MVRPMVPNTGMLRVYLKTRSQTQKESSAPRLRSMRSLDDGPCSFAKSEPKGSEPEATSSGLKFARAVTLWMRRPTIVSVVAIIRTDIQKKGFLHRSRRVSSAAGLVGALGAGALTLRGMHGQHVMEDCREGGSANGSGWPLAFHASLKALPST